MASLGALVSLAGCGLSVDQPALDELVSETIKTVGSDAAATCTASSAFAGASSADQITGSSATIHWAKQDCAVSYAIYNVTSGTPVSIGSASSDETSFTATGLNALSTYKFRVRAIDSSGEQDTNTADVTITTLASALPDAPTLFSAGAITDTSLAFSWTNVATNATSIEIQKCSGSGCTNYTPVLLSPLAATASSHTETGLTASTVYNFRIRATNANGSSGWLTGSMTTGAASGAAFAGISSIDQVTATSVRVNWASHGAAISYVIYDVTSGTPINVGVAGPSATNYVVTGLSPMTGYTFRVRLIDSATGNQDANTNDVATTTIESPIPRAPTNFTVGTRTHSTAEFSWTNVATNATSIEIERCAGSLTACTTTPTYAAVTGSPFTTLPKTSFADSGLTAASHYTYRVRAVNANGSSTWLTGALMTYAETSTFGGISSTSNLTGTTVRLHWVAAAGATGYPVYNVTSGSPSLINTAGAGATSYDVTGLTPNTQYKFRVRRLDAGGDADVNTNDVTITTAAAISVTSITPATGTTNGGLSVTISGAGFQGTPTVSIGGAACNVTASSTTSISCTTAARGVGTVDVVVTNGAPDSQVGTLTNGFQYQPASVDNGQSTVRPNVPKAPHDNSATVTVTIWPKNSSGTPTGAGQTVEASIISGTGTISGNGACRTPAATCVKAFDNGDGSYRVTVRSGNVNTIVVQAVVAGSPDNVVTEQASIDFNSADWVTISANTNIDASATYLGKNLYFTGGTATFVAASEGQTYGHLIVNGGTLTHTATGTTAGSVRKLDIQASSLSLLSGSIDVSALGYTFNRSYGSTGPSTSLASPTYCGGSHGGIGGRSSSVDCYAGTTFDDYRNPTLPGGGGSTNASMASGGGVLRVVSSGECTINSGATIRANGAQSGAGGSIYLRCTSFNGTAGASSITANGTSPSNTAHGAGGGGRIALISTGPATSFSGSFRYPTDAGTVATFKSVVKALGGASVGGGYAGGAGTIYLAHSGSTYGDLIVDNTGITGTLHAGTTFLPSLAGTVTSTHAAGSPSLAVTVTSTPALATSFTNMYAGLRVRPDLAATNGTASDPTDDLIAEVGSNTDTALTMTAGFGAIAAGQSFRSIDLFDHLSVSGGASLESNGDIYVTQGIWSNASVDPTILTLTNAAIHQYGSATLGYPGFAGTKNVTVSSGTFVTNMTSLANLTVSGGGIYFTSSATASGSMTLSGGTLYASGIPTTPSLSITGGTFITYMATGIGTMSISNATANITSNVNVPTLTLGNSATVTVGGTFTTNSNLTVGTGATLTVTGATTIPNLTVSGTGKTTFNGALNVANDITISSSNADAMVATTISATNYSQSAGTVKHPESTTSAIYKLEMNLSGNFTHTGGTIDVTTLGYPSGYSYGSSGTSTALASNTTYGGASHGGLGGFGSGGNSSHVGPTYGDYRNPQLPGAGGSYWGGGGVVRIVAAGSCTINSGATIKSDGGFYGLNYYTGSAGGSVYLRCAAFGGTAGSSAITANGGIGGTATNGRGSGGGGRIALISTGNASSFTGSFTYPVDGGTLGSFKAVVKATGGSTGSGGGNGGAGTIYLAHSGSTYGDLIIDNSGVASNAYGGRTHLPSLAGTVSSNHAAGSNGLAVTVTSSPALSASYANLYAGMRLRPDLGFTNGTASDPTDDGVVTVSTNTNTSLAMTAGFPAVSAGASFRSIDIVDHLSINGGASLESNGDVYAVQGIWDNSSADPTILTLTNATYRLNGSATLGYPSYSGTTNVVITSGTMTSNMSAIDNLTLTGGTFHHVGSLTTPNAIAVSGGTLSVAGTLTAPSLGITGGTVLLGSISAIPSVSVAGGTLTVTNDANIPTFSVGNSATVSIGGALTSNSNLTIGTGSSLTVTGATTLPELTVSSTGATSFTGALTVTNDITISSSSTNAMTATTVSATNYSQSAGTVKHPTSTTSTVYKLEMALTGNFTLSGGTIDVTGRGYPTGYSYGPTGPSTALAPTNYGGGSHAGGGGIDSRYANGPGPTYGDFRNPTLPGGGSNHVGTGGGVVRIVAAAGSCSVASGASIRVDGAANGYGGGAGGSLYMRCASIGGTAGSSSITARGAGATHTNLGSGGGGRIALISTGNMGTFSGSFTYPSNAGFLANFKAVVSANGGTSTGAGGHGGAGTIYLSHSGSTHGDLIIDNASITYTTRNGITDLVSTTANSNVLSNASSGSNAVAIAPSGSPLANRLDWLKGYKLGFWSTASSDDPLDLSHSIYEIASNGANAITLAAGTFPNIAADHEYRVTYELDHLDIAGNALVNTLGADVILVGCDLHSADTTKFDVPTGSSITGNSIASANCQDAKVGTKGTTVNFTNYFLQ